MYRGDYNKVLSSPGQGGLERGSDSAQRAAQEVREPNGMFWSTERVSRETRAATLGFCGHI